MSIVPTTDDPRVEQPLTEGTDEAPKKHLKQLKAAIAATKNYRRKLIKNWETNVSYRRGKPFSTQSDEDRVAVNLDWSLTKMKQAALFSQVPAVRLNHPPQTINKETSPWLHTYEQRINDMLINAGVETALDEALPDCINAAGIGVIMVSLESLTEDVEVPAIDMATMPPQIQQQILQSGMMPDGTPVPMEVVPRVVDKRYQVNRISPADFLWPLSFTGSDYDKAPWIGRSGRLPWAEAQQRFNLDESLKQKYLGVETNEQDQISHDADRDPSEDEFVSFDEIFYRERSYDSSVKYFNAIHHTVFITGQDEPIIDEPWKGQEFDQEGNQYIGALIYPIRVLTLTYITDEAIPPSDSAIGRSQVDEINTSRTQMILQRLYSFPIRTFDVNRIDQAIQHRLMMGKWQGMIPVQGNGASIITEVSRSNFPQENYSFDQIANRDLSNMWQVGQDNAGSDVETKGEAQFINANASTRIARERARVGKFFTTIAEVLGGLIAIYEDPSFFGEGFNPSVSKTLNYSILADSTVLLDSNQRLRKLIDFFNLTAKTGWVSMEPILKEMATLSGLDPNTVIAAPQPRPPAEPNISLRLTGTEDLINPIAYAFLMKSGQAPDIKLIEEAKKHIEAGMAPPERPVPQLGPDGQLLPPPPENGTAPSPAPPAVGDANPNLSAMPKVNQRVLERGK